jgi:hypothetical protein
MSGQRSKSPNGPARTGRCEIGQDPQACSDARWPPQNPASFPHMVLCCPIGVSGAAPRRRRGENRPSGEVEHFVAYAGSTAVAMAGVRIGPKPITYYRVLLAVRRHTGVLPALLTRSTSRLSGFRGVGAWSAVRRARYCAPLAAPFRLAALSIVGSGGRLIPPIGTKAGRAFGRLT